MQQVAKKKIFIVKEMNHEDLLDFAALLKVPLQHRKISKDQNNVYWRKVK
jgi:hypothetical protein